MFLVSYEINWVIMHCFHKVIGSLGGQWWNITENKKFNNVIFDKPVVFILFLYSINYKLYAFQI